ncbi:MAG: DUF6120 family protein [Eubacteriaceae bacterium]|nr:DUF6120 family protein [Eubacteriaceae bacterium]
MNNNKELKRYFRQIKSLLPVYTKEEKKFLRDYKKSVIDYAADNPDLSFDDIMEHFDEPTDVVYNYIVATDQEYLYKRISLSSMLKKVLIVITIAALIAFGLRYHYLYSLYLEVQNQIITEETTVIE